METLENTSGKAEFSKMEGEGSPMKTCNSLGIRKKILKSGKP